MRDKSSALILIAVSLLSVLLSARADQYGPYSYTTENGAVTLTGYEGSDTFLVIPDNISNAPITTIGQSAFYNKDTLLYVHLPDSVTTIEPWAFSYCDNLVEIQMGAGLINIGYQAFYSDPRLGAFTVAAGNMVYSDLGGVLFNHDQTRLLQYPLARPGDYTVPNTVVSIADQAFYGCTNPAQIFLPNGLLEIGLQAFGGCTGLTTAAIPDSVTNRLYQCFINCEGLTSVSIGDNVPALDGTFFDCHNLANVTLGTGVTNLTETFVRCYNLRHFDIPTQITVLGEMAFAGSGIRFIDIPSFIDTVGYSAFSGCESLTNAALHEGLFNIGSHAFDRCTSLTSIQLPDSVTNLQAEAFNFCRAAQNIHLGEGLVSIGSQAFYGCGGATNIDFGSQVNTVGSYAFGGCTNLTAVTLPNSVISLEPYAFAECSRLTSVELNENLATIGNSAFGWCSLLPAISIPASVTNIGYLAFQQCDALTAINVVSGNPAFTTVDGILYDHTGTLLLAYPAGKSANVVIPDGTLRIESYAFEYCRGITNLEIPGTVTSIGDSAFDNCSGLNSLIIPASVTNIGFYAFDYCLALQTVLFEGNAPTVQNGAFFNNPINLYYLPGTTGWESGVLGDRTTTLWNPAILADADFGVKNNQFGFNLSGNSNLTVVIEATTNFDGTAWVPVGTNSLTTGQAYFADPDWHTHPERFYRIQRPQ